MKTFQRKKSRFSHKLSVNPFVPILENYYNFQNCSDGAISCHYRQCQSRSYHLDLSTLYSLPVFSIHHILSPDLTLTIKYLYFRYKKKLDKRQFKEKLFLSLLISNGNFFITPCLSRCWTIVCFVNNTRRWPKMSDHDQTSRLDPKVWSGCEVVDACGEWCVEMILN